MFGSEIFLSIQGESTYSGLPCVFIRLAGCNLGCEWCDTTYARVEDGSRELTVDGALKEIRSYNCPRVEITGGEPLLQEETNELASKLLDEGYSVLMETNGSRSLDGLDQRLVKVVDVKCPSSGFAGAFLVENLDFITPGDEVKFVVGDRTDYEFAKRFLEEFIQDRTEKVLFAPVRPDMDPRELADWILRDRLKVRLQLQIHSYIWEEKRGK